MRARLIRAWESFWFASESPVNLAAARILIAVHALWILLSRDPAGLSGLPPEFWASVRTGARWRFLVFEGHPGLEHALEGLAVVALVAAAIGLWSRATCLLAGLLLYHLAPLETLIFTPSPWPKGFTISVLGLLVLGFSPCGDALAVGTRGSGEPLRSADYGWPRRLIQVFLCEVYLFAGYAKLFKTGWEWLGGEAVRRYLLQYAQNPQMAVFHSLGPWIADRPLLCTSAAVGSLVFDLAFWTVLVSKRARWVLVPVALIGHLLILLSFNIAFLETPLLLLFVDWEALGGRGARRDEAAAAPARVPA